MASSDLVARLDAREPALAARAIGRVVRLLCEVRLAVLVIGVVTTFSDAALTVPALVIGLLAAPFSYFPARSWEARGHALSRSGILLASDMVATVIVMAVIRGSEVMIIYGAATVALFGLMVGVRLSVFMSVPIALTLLASAPILEEDYRWAVVLGGATGVIAMAWAGSALGEALRTQAVVGQQLTHTRERRAADLERLQIARDLHDSVAGNLAGLALLSGALDRQLKSDGASEASRALAAQVVEGCRDAHRDTRVVLGELRRIDEDPIELLETICANWAQRTETVIDVSVDDSVTGTPADVLDDLRAILLELLENVRRHAGACTVTVDVALVGGEVRLRVHDDGLGFRSGSAGASPTNPVGHYGLRGIRERAAVSGGTVDITSNRGGTTVDVSLEARAAHEPQAQELLTT